MHVPTHEDCEQYFKYYEVPENIRAHCRKVHQVAVYLAEQLAKEDVLINTYLVDACSYLHDLFKIAAINDITPTKQFPREFSQEELAMREHLQKKYPEQKEHEIFYEEFKQTYPELAIFMLTTFSENSSNLEWEQAIIKYADMRCLGKGIVDLQVRLVYMKDTYFQGKEAAWQAFANFFCSLEQKIFKQLNFDPDELKEKVEENDG